MADTIISTQGSATVTLAASDKIALYSPQEYQVFQVVGYPNFPGTLDLLFQGSGFYTSSAFSAAGQVVVNAGSAPVTYNVGTAAVVGRVVNVPTQGAPTALNATGDLTAAAMLSGIVTSTTAAAVTATFITGAVLDAAVDMGVGDFFDWSAINTGGSNAFTVTAGVTGMTLVGAGAVAANSSGRFRTRKTAAETFVTYRLS